jgi:hypothetical protein
MVMVLVVTETAAVEVDIAAVPWGITSLLPSFKVPPETVRVPAFQSEAAPVPVPPNVRLPVPE